MIKYAVPIQTMVDMLSVNLKIRHYIADMLPYLEDSDRERYQEFFRYTERLDKRIYVDYSKKGLQ